MKVSVLSCVRCSVRPSVLGLLVLALWSTFRSSCPAQSEFESEKSPSLGYYDQEKLRQQAKERQELFRKRIVIADAVKDDVPMVPSLQQAAVRRPAPAENVSRMDRRDLIILFLLASIGVLAIRKLAPEVASYFNERFNPWAFPTAFQFALPARVRVEDEAVSEYISALQNGPWEKPKPLADAAIESDALKSLRAEATRLLAEARQRLHEIGRTSSELSRQKKVAELRDTIHEFTSTASPHELRPIWQVAAALDGLLKQLTAKATNVNASTLRTVAGSIDVLSEMCKLGVPADLLSDPPVRLLAVDDDLISRNAVSIALRRMISAPDLAVNGETALTLANQTAYDVIFLDVQMPGMDGFELCTRIHETALNKTTPVVFVTCLDDFDARAQSTLSGGTDLMVKPFLTFEIALKALNLAVRSRLQARPGARAADPAQEPKAKPQPEASTIQRESAVAGQAQTDLSPLRESQPVAESPQPDRPGIARELSPSDPTTAFLGRAKTHLGRLRDLMYAALQAEAGAARQEILGELYLILRALAPSSSSVLGHPAIRLNLALEGLLKRLVENPKHCTESTLLTSADALDLLNDLCVAGITADLATAPQIRLLIVDDDPVARRAITCALQMAFKKPDCATSGEEAIQMAAQNPYDAIFMDVIMPGMDGFAACSKIRETAPNCTTPILFVTVQADANARKQSSKCGGDDLIKKPFLTAEITVKALTFALRARLQKLHPARNVIALQSEQKWNEAPQKGPLPAAS